MKIKNNAILCVFALTTLAATFGSCRSEDDDLTRLPHGSVPLELGDVTVAGTRTANNRAAGGSTRAAIEENTATGYTGIRKSHFVNGDVLSLTLTDGGITTPVTATLTDGKWTLNPATVFINPGVTEITATHTATEQSAGITPDNLAAAHADCAVTAGKVSIGMKHAGAMIDITYSAYAWHDNTLTIKANELPTVAEEEADGKKHYRTIAPVGGADISSITAVINGNTFVARLATPITPAPNKRYPIALTFDSKLTATVSAPQDWADGGTVPVPGYTRIIDSPEALAQFAQDVNDDNAWSGASLAIVLQTKDIDLSKLKLAADAGTNPLTGTAYTYTATADSWTPIGANGIRFKGKFNGNGHTIYNMKITTENSSNGFFGSIADAALTGINLRNGSITKVTSGGPNCGMLASDVTNSVVSLCSATGTIDVEGAGYPGGLIGSAGASHITRCSANVKVSNTSYGLSTFIGNLANNSLVLGCSSTGDIMPKATTSATSTYGLTSGTGTVMGCYFGGATMNCLYFGADNNISCYALAGTGRFADNYYSYTDCAYAGTSSLTGVASNATPAMAYGILTASNAKIENVKTLHWSKEDGYTLTEVTATWYASDIWKDNGTANPTIDMTYEGTPLYNSQPANLLAIPGQTAYWVAPVDASANIEWENINFSTICPEGWHVPTREEFVAMTGIPADDAYHATNYPAISAAFPANHVYWSSTAESSHKWYMGLRSGDTVISWASGSVSNPVRCVRLK